MYTCYECGSEMKIKYLPFEYEADGEVYTIPNVKTIICNCGSRYYDKEGNKQIDEYKEN